MRTRHAALTGALGAVTGLLVAVTAAGFLGRRWWVFDVASNLRLHLALVLLLLTVLLLARRRWRLSAVAGLAGVLNLALVLPWLLPTEPAPAAPQADTLQVTYLNTKIRAADRAEVIAYLRTTDDDVVVLAATTGAWVRDLEAADLDLEVVTGTHLDPGLELLTLVREPDDVEVVVHRPTPEDRDALVEVVLPMDGGPVHLLTTHAVSPQTPARAYRRDRSFMWIADWAQRRDGPVVVIGDLNTTPWSPRFRDLVDDGGLVDPLRSHGHQPSWPAPFDRVGLPIDHVLHSPELTTIERHLGPSFGSDHRAVHATLATRAPDD